METRRNTAERARLRQYRLTLDVVPVLKEDLERNVYLKEEAIRKLEAELEELKGRLN